MVNFRPSLLPVTVILRQRDRFARCPVNKFKRTGADRMQSQLRFVRVLLKNGWTPHHRRRMRQRVDKGPERLIQIDFYLVGCHYRDLIDHFVEAITLQPFFLICQTIKVCFDRIGIKRGTVLESDTFAQRQRKFGGTVIRGITGRQPGLQLHRGIKLEQPLKDAALHRVADIIRGVMWIQPRDIGIH